MVWMADWTHLTRRFRPFTSAAFRFALIIAGVFALASVLLLGVVHRQVGHYAHDAITQSLTTETHILLGRSRAELVAEIDRRLHSDTNNTFDYLLLDPAGHRLIGTIPVAAVHEGWGDVLMVEHGSLAGEREKPETLRFLATRLGDGSLLAVATDGFDVDRLGGHMARFTTIWAVGVTLLALLGGWIAGWMFLGRLAAANTAIERIMSGNTDQRLPMIGFAPELDELARNLNRMLDRIEGLMAGLKQVSTDVAHDLRTPLTRLRQMLETMQDDLRKEAPTPGMEAAVDAALGQTDLLLGTFRAILRLAQIEGGGRRARFETVDLAELITGLIEIYEPVASDSGHRLRAVVGDDAIVHGDSELLAQMFANLIENAIIHTPAGTQVSVEMESDEGAIAIVVADNGPGVDEAHRARLTQRFYQADPSRNAGGVGLGLAMASAIAQLHAVDLRIESADPGLKVRVVFPPSSHARLPQA